jgi:hypothetical protein
MYEVIVGNIGTVYSGDNLEHATAIFDSYVAQSRSTFGRAAGESVTLLQDDDIIREYEVEHE